MVALARRLAPALNIEVQPLDDGHLHAASLLLTHTCLQHTRAELLRELHRNHAEWPMLQLGAFGPGGELWGVATGTIDEWDLTVGWCFDLVVAEGHRGLGVGDALLDCQLLAFEELGVDRVRGQAPASLFHALPFFTRRGFSVVQHIVALSEHGVAGQEEICITERVIGARG